MALCLHPTASKKAPGFHGYTLFDSPQNRKLPDSEAVVFALANSGLVAQASPHPKFPTMLDVFVERTLGEDDISTLLEDLERHMEPKEESKARAALAE